MGQEGMVVEAIKNGALDFIVKPFKADRLIQTVKSALGE
jgi:two-component system chemotaxis response regulator CheY